jgi:hypothetical protein
MHDFVWLASHVLEALYFFWKITLALLVLAGTTGVYSYLVARARFRKEHLLLLSPLPLPLLVLVWGTIMYPLNNPGWSYYVLAVLVLVQIALSVAAFRLARALRWFAATVLMLDLWVTFWCAATVALSHVTSN